MIFEKLKGKINKKKDFIVDKCIFLSLINYINLMTFDFYGKYIYVFKICLNFSSKLGPWDEKTGIFAPLFHQHYQVEAESLRNVVSKL